MLTCPNNGNNQSTLREKVRPHPTKTDSRFRRTKGPAHSPELSITQINFVLQFPDHDQLDLFPSECVVVRMSFPDCEEVAQTQQKLSSH